MKTVIINADDLGIAVSTNEAVAVAHRQGILTSASLMATTPAWEHAIESVVQRHPDLGIGVHLSLTSGQAVSAPASIPLLVDGDGRFRRGFFGLCRLLAGKTRQQALAEIERELRAQLEKIIDAGVQPDHADGHQHVHMIPAVWPCFVQLAAEYRIGVVRLTDEPFDLRSRPLLGWLRSTRRLNPAKRCLLSTWASRNRRVLSEMRDDPRIPRCTDWFCGLLDSGCMDARTLCRLLARVPEGVGEIALHPGYVKDTADGGGAVDQRADRQASLSLSEEDRDFVRSRARLKETEALLAPAVRAACDTAGVVRANFRTAFAHSPALV